ncbi:MAG: LptE family protein [Ignavibacteriales bacterium]|nr:LptE family protein [Ignavibacteriales bacterium]
MELNKECLSKRVRKCLRLFLVFISLISGIIILQSCSYSFTGSSVPSHLKSISIPVFSDKSGSGEFDLNRKLTTQLIQKFIDDNTLLVSDKLNSDSFLDGTIIALSDAPNIVSGGERVTSRRITITVHAVYKDLVKKQQIFDKNFSNYGDYIVSGDITSVRNVAIQTAIDKIAEDILLGVVSNW